MPLTSPKGYLNQVETALITILGVIVVVLSTPWVSNAITSLTGIAGTSIATGLGIVTTLLTLITAGQPIPQSTQNIAETTAKVIEAFVPITPTSNVGTGAETVQSNAA